MVDQTAWAREHIPLFQRYNNSLGIDGGHVQWSSLHLGGRFISGKVLTGVSSRRLFLIALQTGTHTYRNRLQSCLPLQFLWDHFDYVVVFGSIADCRLVHIHIGIGVQS